MTEREVQALPYDVLSIDVDTCNDLGGFFKDYPYVIATKEVFTRKEADECIAQGWKEAGYDHYMDYYRMRRPEDIRKEIRNIVIKFKKKTTEEDKAVLGFAKDYMIGSYAYPVPDDMKEEIAKALYDHKGSLDPETEHKIFDRFSDTFLQDEYKALCGLKKQYEENNSNVIRRSR